MTLVGIVMVMVRYWWSSDRDCGDDGCCNVGSMIKSSLNFFFMFLAVVVVVVLVVVL